MSFENNPLKNTTGHQLLALEIIKYLEPKKVKIVVENGVAKIVEKPFFIEVEIEDKDFDDTKFRRYDPSLPLLYSIPFIKKYRRFNPPNRSTSTRLSQ